FARSKDGEGNSYNTSNEQNELVWTNLTYYGDLVEYYKGLMQIRNNFSAFRDATNASAESINYLNDMPDGVVGYTLNNNESGKWNTVCVIFNGNSETDQKVNISGDNLPEEWVILADGETAGLRNLGVVKGEVTVPKSSALILVDKEGYENAGITSDKGAVNVKYYDNSTREIFASDTITGKIGDEFDVTANNVISMNYNIVNTDGSAKGKFTDEIQHVSVYCDKYEGTYSNVTFKYIDAANEGMLADSIVMSNREGQSYTTFSIPSIEGYNLDLDNLPENGCGKFGDKDIEVIYKYNKTTEDQKDVCRVNSIYMDTEGKILDKVTVTGEENTEFNSEEKEFNGYSIVQSPYNAQGTFVKGEINILYIYMADEASGLPVIVSICSVAFLLLIGGGIFAFSTIRSKKRNKAELDIED
ncbi:MAG: MucBP domain-containing protein, partial [Oscillospiraceae bacterium]|nr:MucBP domain-containing protein [Oscillospiraceae bacterium]